jgi:hypothetical protein
MDSSPIHNLDLYNTQVPISKVDEWVGTLLPSFTGLDPMQ